MNYYRRYLGDYMRDTMHLSIMEHGAYNLLLDACYATEKPLPADFEGLYRICRAMSKPEQDAVKRVAESFFPIGQDGMRHNPRADRELAIGQATIEKQRKSGVDSAAKRWSSDKSTDGLTDRSAIQPPTTNHQPPAVNRQPPSANRQLNPVDPRPKNRANGSPARSAAVFESYAAAYRERYGVNPMRNAKVNSLLCQVIDRLGEVAPQVAAFYVRHNQAFYVRSKHSVGLLLQDAEGLHTEWATGNRVTETQARQADRTQANGDVFGRLIAEADAREKTA